MGTVHLLVMYVALSTRLVAFAVPRTVTAILCYLRDAILCCFT